MTCRRFSRIIQYRQRTIQVSFIPPQAQRDLRDLNRQRTNLVQGRTAVVNRLQKVCEWSNLKLSAVATVRGTGSDGFQVGKCPALAAKAEVDLLGKEVTIDRIIALVLTAIVTLAAGRRKRKRVA